MMNKHLLLLFLPLVWSIQSQELDSYKWKNRIVLIISENVTSPLVAQQIRILQTNPEALIERKLILCRLHPEKFGIVDDKGTNWIENSDLYDLYASEDGTFKTALIGLDGSVKLSKDQLLTPEELFSTIDRMPMRRRELKENNN